MSDSISTKSFTKSILYVNDIVSTRLRMVNLSNFLAQCVFASHILLNERVRRIAHIMNR